jgi:hypothetical protein
MGIIPYNGGASYTPIGIIRNNPNQSNGFGTVFVAINGLQNGAPDASISDNLGSVQIFKL